MRMIGAFESVGVEELQRAVVRRREEVEVPFPADEAAVGVALTRQQHTAQLEAARKGARDVEANLALDIALGNQEDLALVLEDERIGQVEGLVEGDASEPPGARGSHLGPGD